MQQIQNEETNCRFAYVSHYSSLRTSISAHSLQLRKFFESTTRVEQVLRTTTEVKEKDGVGDCDLQTARAIRKHRRTNIVVMNEELWAWAQYRPNSWVTLPPCAPRRKNMIKERRSIRD